MNYRYMVYGLKVKSQIKFDEFIEDTNSDDIYDVEIINGDISEEICNKVRNGRKVFTSNHIVWFHIDNIATYVIENGNKIIVKSYDNAELKDIKSYIVGSCFGHLLYQKGILAIHGGALGINNKAIVFVGESGSGKSTLTTALRLKGLGFLSDDLAAIDLGEQISVNPGYPGQRLCKDGMDMFKYSKCEFTRIDLDKKTKYTIPVNESFIKEKTKMEAIIEISVDDTEKVKFEEIKGSEKLKLLLRNTYCLNSVKHLGVSKEYFFKCLAVVKEIKMYKLTRPRSGFTVNEQINKINEYLGVIYDKGEISNA